MLDKLMPWWLFNYLLPLVSSICLMEYGANGWYQYLWNTQHLYLFQYIFVKLCITSTTCRVNSHCLPSLTSGDESGVQIRWLLHTSGCC